MEKDKKIIEFNSECELSKLKDVKILKKHTDLESIKIRNDLKIISLTKENADACLALQNSLSNNDKETVKLRSKEEYEYATIKNNQLLGIFVPNYKEQTKKIGKIVATSAIVETKCENNILFGEKCPYNNLIHNSKTKLFELSISIAHERYRGNGFQTKLFQQLLISKKTKKLIQNNQILLIAACKLENLASANSLLSAGLELCNITNVNVNGKILTSLIFAKKAEELELEKSDYLKTHLELLKTSMVLEKLDNEILKNEKELRNICDAGKTILKIKENGKTTFFSRTHKQNI